MSFFEESAGPRRNSPLYVFFSINPRTGTFEQHSAPRSLVEDWRWEVGRAAHDKLLQHRAERGAPDASDAKYAILDQWVRSSLDTILLGPPTSLRRVKPTFDELLLPVPELLAIVQRTRRSLSLFGPACFELSEFVVRFKAVVSSAVIRYRDTRRQTRKRNRGDDGPEEKMQVLLMLLPHVPRRFASTSELEQFAIQVLGRETTTVIMRKTVMSLYQSRMDDFKRDVTEKKCVLSGRVGGGIMLPLEVRDAIARMAVLGDPCP